MLKLSAGRKAVLASGPVIDLNLVSSVVLNSCYFTLEADLREALVLFQSENFLASQMARSYPAHLLGFICDNFGGFSMVTFCGGSQSGGFPLHSQLSQQGHFEEIWTCSQIEWCYLDLVYMQNWKFPFQLL